MLNGLLKPAILGSTAIGLAFGLAYSAQAATVLPVQNLTFSQYNGTAPKGNFQDVNPVGWTQSPAVQGATNLVAIDAPGTATTAVALHNAYAVYGPFANPPPGGNFIQADGNPQYEDTFEQSISGLTAGTTYTLSFWQAAGQQSGFTGQTTEQWIVFLGNNNPTLSGPDAQGFYTYNANGDDVVASPVMTTPSGGSSPWQQVTLDLTAPTTGSDTLWFLAWGDNGSDVNQPPTVFLAGVNTPAPEPATLALLTAGLLGVAGAARRRRAKRNDG